MFGRFGKKPQAPEGRVPPGQVLTQRFPVLTDAPTPQISTQEFRLRVWGQVNHPQEFDWAALMALPQSQQIADFHCVTRWSKLDVDWSGVRVVDLLAVVQPTPQARAVLLHCYGGYTTNLTLADLDQPPNLLAHTLEGHPLPRDHGGPLRLVVPHLYAWKSAKWLRGLEFLDQEELGFWEVNGYHRRGDPWREERFERD